MQVIDNKYLVVIAGPTAVGKTKVAVALAQYLKTEVINADSRQVFKELNIGTAKPTFEEMGGIKHYFVDNLSLNETFSAGIFEKQALATLSKLHSNHNVAILSGGSGLYIQAVCQGMDEIPEVPDSFRSTLQKELTIHGHSALLEELEKKDYKYFKIVDKNNPQRIIRALEVIRFTGKSFSQFRRKEAKPRSFKTIKIALDLPRDELYSRIEKRMDKMLEKGLVKEAKSLIEWESHNALQTVGYQEVFGYLDNKYDHSEMVRLLKRNSRRYAKRQLTWIRKDPEFTWFHPKDIQEMIAFIENEMV